MRKAKIACLGLAATLCASVAVAEDIYVQAYQTEIRSDGNGLAPVITKVPRGTALTVLEHKGRWIKVQAPTTQGYVFAGALTAEKPGFDLNLGNIAADKQLQEGAAGKGLGPTATEYAKGKNMDPKLLDDVIAFRQKVDPKAWEGFCAEGKVGPSKP